MKINFNGINKIIAYNHVKITIYYNKLLINVLFIVNNIMTKKIINV